MIQWIIPLALICTGLIAGAIFEKFILNRLKKIATRSRLPGNEIIFHSLHGITKLWLFLAGFYGAVLASPLNPVFSDILRKTLTVIFLFSITLVSARLAVSFVTLWSQRVERLSASLLSSLARVLVLGIGILVILNFLGVNITPILAALGIGGLAVALAFQDTLSNLFSGLYLLISGQVRTGDYVKLETGQEGYITDITWRNTAIRELPNNIIIVPNSKLASAIFTNYHLPAKEITLTVQVGVSYKSDLEQVEQVTIEVAKEVMQTVSGEFPGFEPFILYQSFGESSITFTVFLRVKEFLEQRIAKHQFIKRLHQRYKEEGIEIPFPSRNVYLKE